jgi:hypothetical protein
MKPKSNHVIPSKSTGWAVKKFGADRAIKNFSTKEDAVKFGRSLSVSEKSELYIHKKDGTIQNRNSYATDPLPPSDKKR